MSLRLLVDEDTQAKALVALLRAAGHDVLTVSEAGLEAAGDDLVLDRAAETGRITLTHNCDHFRDMHRSGRYHAGIIAVYLSQYPAKNMGRDDIIRALTNLEASGVPIAGEFVALNEWQF